MFNSTVILIVLFSILFYFIINEQITDQNRIFIIIGFVIVVILFAYFVGVTLPEHFEMSARAPRAMVIPQNKGYINLNSPQNIGATTSSQNMGSTTNYEYGSPIIHMPSDTVSGAIIPSPTTLPQMPIPTDSMNQPIPKTLDQIVPTLNGQQMPMNSGGEMETCKNLCSKVQKMCG